MVWIPLSFLIAAAVVGGVATEVVLRRGFRPFRERPPAMPEWAAAFPTATASEIESFLDVFADGFSLRTRHARRLRPADRVMDVHRALNPPDWSVGDQCELEFLAILFRRQYGVALESAWRPDISLGNLFALSVSRRSTHAEGGGLGVGPSSS